MTNEYVDILTKEERAVAIAMGMKAAEAEYAQTTGEKQARVTDIPEAGKDLLYTFLAASVLGGVPIGLAAHSFNQARKKTNKKEIERLGTIDQYLDAADRIGNSASSNFAV